MRLVVACHPRLISTPNRRICSSEQAVNMLMLRLFTVIVSVPNLRFRKHRKALVL